MMRHQWVLGFLMMLGVATTARGQLLNGDSSFPVLNETTWASKINEVKDLCVRRRVGDTSTDSTIIISVPMFGFAARTELQFEHKLKMLKLVQVKFSEPTKTLVDSLTSHFTRRLGQAPLRTMKEKSVLIVTLRMEIASWRLPTGLVNLVTARRGDSLFDASLVLLPPTVQQKSPDAK